MRRATTLRALPRFRQARRRGRRVWSAVHRSQDGRHIRAIVVQTAGKLAAKLEIAEQAGL